MHTKEDTAEVHQTVEQMKTEKKSKERALEELVQAFRALLSTSNQVSRHQIANEQRLSSKEEDKRK